MRRWIGIGLAVLAGCGAACGAGGGSAASGSAAARAAAAVDAAYATAAAHPVGTPRRVLPATNGAVGPFAGLRWPAARLPAGVLVHDDGTHLWIVPLHGYPRLVWTHPQVQVAAIAAGPGGHELAMVVDPIWGSPSLRQFPPISQVLYLLEPDGSIHTVDTNGAGSAPESPVFIRPPGDPRGPVRLAWVQQNQNSPSAHVMTYADGTVEPVTVGFAPGEQPLSLAAYPGSDMVAVTALHAPDQDPFVAQLLLDVGLPRGTAYHWPALEDYAGTDITDGPAWISPGEFVAPLGLGGALYGNAPESLRVFANGCQGSHIAYTGEAVDAPGPGPAWPLLPLDRNHVLVLLHADVLRVFNGRVATAPWYELDVWSGRLRETAARWSPSGWWAETQPVARPAGVPHSCVGFGAYP